MITISYQQLMNQGFMMAMQKITNTPLPTKVAYQLKKITDDLQKHRIRVGDEYTAEILKKFAKLNDKGEIEGMGEIPEERQEAFSKAQDEFGKKTVSVDRFKIALQDLEGAKLTANDLTNLDAIISDPENQGTAQILPMKGGA